MSANLAVIPSGWNLRDLGHLDSSVTYNGNPSIRIDGPPTAANPYREVDTYGVIPVKPGDHLVFKVWIKTAPSTSGGGGGALMGLDLFGPSGRLWEVVPGTTTNFNDPGYGWQGAYQWVPYNTDWTLRTLDFYVPTLNFTTTDGGSPVPPQQVNGFVAWMYMHNEQDAGAGYFADAELYINPSVTPPPPTNYTVVGASSPADGGSIVTNLGNLPQTVASGTQLTVGAVPAANHFFNGWLINNVATLGNPITLNINSPFAVVALFPAITGPQTTTLTVQATSGGTTTPPAGSYTGPIEQTLTIIATPNQGYEAQWSLDGAPQGTPSTSATTLSVTMSADHTASATFTPVQVTPPPPKGSIAARVPYFGNRRLVQVYLRRVRDKLISRKLHEKLHPLV